MAFRREDKRGGQRRMENGRELKADEKEEEEEKEESTYGLLNKWRGMRLGLSDTVPDLSIGRKEEKEEKEEIVRKKSVKCHHHLLPSDQNTDDGSNVFFCSLCRKKEVRLKNIQRPFQSDDFDGREESTSDDLLINTDHTNNGHFSPSDDHDSQLSSSPLYDPEQEELDDLSSSQSSPAVDDDSHSSGHRSNEGQRLSGQFSSGHNTGRSILAQNNNGRSSTSQTTGGQAVILNKLQGALSKMSPKIFKSTKKETTPVVTKQDQKILSIMLAKKQEEEKQRKLREMAHCQWEEEMAKNKEHSNVTTATNRRRRSTAEGVSNNRRSHQQQQHKKSEDDMTKDNNEAPCTAHGSSTQPSLVVYSPADRDADSDYRGSTRSLLSRLDPRQQKTREKQIQAMERKKSVEQRLEHKRREMEEHKEQLKRKQEQDFERANSVRMSREQQQNLRSRLKNLQSDLKQEKINEIKRQSMQDLSHRKEEIQIKLSRAELKVQKLREDEAHKKRDDLEKRIEQSRLKQEQIELEQKEWQQELLKYQKWKDYQADGLAKENRMKKREATCAERIQKEKLQRENMKRLFAQEEQWLNDVEATIAMKDARIKTAQKEKEEQIQRSRMMASNSQRMREELKYHYSMNDLDQVTRQVALENRITGRGVSNRFNASQATHNQSTLTLGGDH